MSIATTGPARPVEFRGAGHTGAGDDNDAFTEAVAEFV